MAQTQRRQGQCHRRGGGRGSKHGSMYLRSKLLAKKLGKNRKMCKNRGLAFPELSAFRRASSLMMPPRAQLTMITPSFIWHITSCGKGQSKVNSQLLAQGKATTGMQQQQQQTREENERPQQKQRHPDFKKQFHPARGTISPRAQDYNAHTARQGRAVVVPAKHARLNESSTKSTIGVCPSLLCMRDVHAAYIH